MVSTQRFVFVLAAVALASTASLHAGVVTESFEGLTPGPNVGAIPGTGFLQPGINGTFLFQSGVSLVFPTSTGASSGNVFVGDFSLGSAEFGLGPNGLVTSANVPDGSAYLALDGPPGPIEFTFPTGVRSVSALVASAYTTMDLIAFDAQGNVVAASAATSLSAFGWPTNVLSVTSPTDISTVVFEDGNGSFTDTFVLDDLKFTTASSPAPEPAYMPILLVLGCAAIVWKSRRKPALLPAPQNQHGVQPSEGE